MRKAIAPVALATVTMLFAGCADDNDAITTAAPSVIEVQHIENTSDLGEVLGWKKSDRLPNNVVEHVDYAEVPWRQPLWVRAGVAKIEPWYAEIYDVEEGEGYGDDDLIRVDFDDPRVETKRGWQVWKVYLDVQHTFGDERPVPEYVTLNGGVVPAPAEGQPDDVAEKMAASLAQTSDALWILSNDEGLYPVLTASAEVYPIDENGKLEFEDFVKIDKLERKSEGPGQVIVIGRDDEDQLRVVERRDRT